MNIIFDFDGVICSSQEEMMRRLSARTGKNFTINDWTVYNPKYCFGEYTDELKKIFCENLYVGPACKIYKETVNAMLLAQDRGHNVKIVTVCANEQVYKNKLMLMQDKGIEGIEIVPIYEGDKRGYKCDMLIEDCIETLETSSAKYKILVQKPWNIGRAKDDMLVALDDSGVFSFVDTITAQI